MLVLALDTTTRPGSLALLRGQDVIAVESGEGSQPHAERLPGEIVRMLSRHGLDVRTVDLFAVAAGPGSFTGLRIGIATIQGLAFALGRPVVGVSALDALAALGIEQAAIDRSSGGNLLVGAFMDAQRAEVFGALYEASGVGLRPSAVGPGALRPGAGLALLDGPVSEPPAIVLDRWRQLAAGSKAERAILFAGDGVARYRDLVVGRFGSGFRSVAPLPPLAGVIGRLALIEAAAGRATSPHAIRPIYVRRSDAELARDRDAPARSHEP